MSAMAVRKSSPRRKKPSPQRILVIDVGGSHVKFLMGRRAKIKIESGPRMHPRRMVRLIRQHIEHWQCEAVSIGYPGVVKDGRITHDPHNLGKGWKGFDFRKAFGIPARVINDAAMQALGAYRGGTMLFLGLGTGLGSTLVVDHTVVPMELAHLHLPARTVPSKAWWGMQRASVSGMQNGGDTSLTSSRRCAAPFCRTTSSSAVAT